MKKLLCAAVVVLGCYFALGQQYKVLWNFGGPNDGIAPRGQLALDRAGNLYGTTWYSSGPNCSSACGTVYKLSPTASGWKETILHTFCSQPNCADGEVPWAGLIWGRSGNLYGTTSLSGPNVFGTVFELSPPSLPGGDWSLKTLWAFNRSNGATPVGRLTWDSSGNLFGTTSGGGDYNCGTVFELTPVSGGWSERVLHSMNRDTDGCGSYAGVTFDRSGNIYATTEEGGDVSCDGGEGCGTLFELSQNPDQTWSETILIEFGYAVGGHPFGEVSFDPKGNLYTTFSTFGSNCLICGGGFRMANVGGRLEESASLFFDGQDGAEPWAGLLLDVKGRSAYGTTVTGGVSNSCVYPSGCGTAFVMHEGKESVLYNFCSQPECTDGLEPWSTPIADKAGNLYGTTYGGGLYNQGVVFEIAQASK